MKNALTFLNLFPEAEDIYLKVKQSAVDPEATPDSLTFTHKKV